MEIVELPVKALKPYKNNPRKNDKAVEYVANSIRQFGFKVPIVIDSNYEIVCGHTRWKAAKTLGLMTVPCVMADDLNEDQIRAFRLADNKTAEMAGWDFDLLEMEFNDIDPDLFDLSDFGFFQDGEEPEKAPTEVTEDDFDESTVTDAVCKRGQIWQLGAHRLMCGDSTSADDVAKLMNGEKADMVFTDPPYGVSYAEKNVFLNSIGKPNACGDAIQEDDKSPEEMNKFWVKAFTNLYDFTSDHASYYITSPQGGDLLLLLLAVKESGFQLKHNLIWNKNNHVLGRSDYNYKHEPIIYGWKQNKTHRFYGKGKYLTSVWDIPKPLSSKLHPTMKPIELIANAVENSTIKNDFVLDLFGGSGSTLIACEQLDRRCFMMEISEHYCDVIIKRWEDFTGKKAELIED